MANQHRGAVAITLEGTEYTLLPTFEAVAAIDEQLGGILAVARRSFEGGALTLQEVAVIVNEGIRAYGRDTNTATLAGSQLGNVKRMVFASGLIDCLGPTMTFLQASLSGGSAPNPPTAEGETA